jgi:hypothetical protein
VHHGAGEALVGHDEVAAAAEHEHRLAHGVRVPHRGDDLVVRLGFDEARGGSADAKRRVLR